MSAMSAMGDDLAFLSAAGLARLVRLRQLSPVDLVNMYLARIERLAKSLGAFI